MIGISDLIGNYLAEDEPSDPANALLAISKAERMTLARRIIVDCPYVVAACSWPYLLAVALLGEADSERSEGEAGLKPSQRHIGDFVHSCLIDYQENHSDMGYYYVVHAFNVLQQMLQEEAEVGEVEEESDDDDGEDYHGNVADQEGFESQTHTGDGLGNENWGEYGGGEGIEGKPDNGDEEEQRAPERHGSKSTGGDRRDKAPAATSTHKTNKREPKPLKDPSSRGTTSYGVRKPTTSQPPQKKTGNERITTVEPSHKVSKSHVSKNKKKRTAIITELQRPKKGGEDSSLGWML